jgi:K+-transporting ATPase KdpF subunit
MSPAAAGSRVPEMGIAHIAGLVVSVLLLGYLTYALLRPERF